MANRAADLPVSSNAGFYLDNFVILILRSILDQTRKREKHLLNIVWLEWLTEAKMAFKIRNRMVSFLDELSACLGKSFNLSMFKSLICKKKDKGGLLSLSKSTEAHQ